MYLEDQDWGNSGLKMSFSFPLITKLNLVFFIFSTCHVYFHLFKSCTAFIEMQVMWSCLSTSTTYFLSSLSPPYPLKHSLQPQSSGSRSSPSAAHRAAELQPGVKTLYDNWMNKMNKMAAVMTQVRGLLHTSCPGHLIIPWRGFTENSSTKSEDKCDPSWVRPQQDNSRLFRLFRFLF